MAEWQRTHTCNELREGHVGQTVTLNGWVLVTRTYGNQVFVDLRDRYGLTQVVFESDNADLYAQAKNVGREWVLSVTGVVRRRLPGAERADIPTGAVEVEAKTLRVLNEPVTERLKFSVTEFPDEEPPNEDLRLQYRYLDLRRRSLQRVLILRHRLCKVIRDFMDANNFLEVETPMLGKSTPEGARDYLVPSRVFNGEFFALPQSPQLYKQLLMVSGFDRYFQIARCLRDEDLRADRQPEFTQLDVEMSFVEREDVLSIMEKLAVEVFEKCLGVKLKTPFPRLSYAEAMAKYGSDKPDLRFGLEIADVTDLVARSTLPDFANAATNGHRVLAIHAPDAANPDPKKANKRREPFTRKLQDAFVKQAEASFPGHKVFYVKHENGAFATGVAKALEPVHAELKQQFNVGEFDMLWLGVGPCVQEAMGFVRTYLGSDVLKLYQNWWDEKAEHDEAEKKKLEAAKKKKETYTPVPFQPRPEHFHFLWVLDFPMFAWNAEENRWDAVHHPFTAPMDEDRDNFFKDESLGKVRAKAYDMVLNGYEVAGGSIRIHRQDVQSRVFEIFGMTQADAQARFGFLLDALRSGAPPHGGIALGLDRWCMMLAGTTNIRDVIAFPKNQRARDLMTGAPSVVDDRQIRELGIELTAATCAQLNERQEKEQKEKEKK
jgi:aspartyl-tRNA synthetase